MSEGVVNNKRIAKNTLILYLRMIIVMAIGFYTSRLVLEALGVDDFGLYNVVGGIVGFFAFLNVSLTQCTQRFLNIEMARQRGEVNKVFSTSLTVHIIIAVILIIIAEALGVWFLNSYIQVPDGRINAANIVFQTSIFSMAMTIVTIPYNAIIIANERMKIFAYIGMLDSILKLLISFMLLYNIGDRLIMYSVLMFLVTLFDFFFYYFYCKRFFTEANYHPCFDKFRIKHLFSLTSWRMFGMSFNILANQGNSILVNVFYSVTANAAMSIGGQVSQAITNLTSNFQTAFTPQITKSYACQDYDNLVKLIYTTSKISFCLLYIISIPIVYNIDFLLNIWLTEVPTFASIFAILSLIEGLVNAISTPLDITILSTGHIKKYHIYYALVYIINLPILYLFFLFGSPPYTAVTIKILISIVIFILRMLILNKLMGAFNLRQYLLKIIIPMLFVTIVCVLMFFALKSLFPHVHPILMTGALLLSAVTVSYTILLQKEERRKLKEIIRKVLNR